MQKQYGKFITFEGGEGAGKSTLSQKLVERINQADLGFKAIWTREPGGTEAAEELREIILSGLGKELGGKGESLLFYAARMHHVNSLIKPALARGDWVICDRFFDSTTAYQMAATGVDEKWLDALRSLCLDDFMPDLTFIIDLPLEIAAERINQRNQKNEHDAVFMPDRFEGEKPLFHAHVRTAFLEIAHKEPKRCMLLDGTQSPETLDMIILTHIKQRLGLDIGMAL